MKISNRIWVWFWGATLIIMGIIMLLNNLGVLDITIRNIIRTYWPILFVVWGLDTLVEANNQKEFGKKSLYDYLFGIILLGIGILFLGRNIGFYEADLGYFLRLIWPLLLIFIGWIILSGTSGLGKSYFALMSGLSLKNEGWKLTNRDFVALMGGIEIDLTAADIPEGETVLGLTAIMGGIDVKVPRDLEVKCSGTAILGGVNFFKNESGGIILSRHIVHKGAEDGSRNVTISCKAVLGGIEVKEV